MKKFLTLFTCSLLLVCTVKSQYVNIPDSGLRVMLMGLYPTCFNAQNQLDSTCSLILQEDSLNVSMWANNSQLISDLYGIQYFKSLVILDCSFQSFSELPTLPSTLKKLDCNSNRANFQQMVLPPSLEVLNCSYCSGLRNLPLLPSTLKWLNCSNGTIRDTIRSLPNGLEYFDASQCSTPIRLSSFPDSLRYFNTNQNYDIRHLPPLPPKLKYLNIGYAYIDSIPAPLPDSLEFLNVTGCDSIYRIPTLPSMLKYLYFQANPVLVMPELPNSLIELACTGYFSQLPASLPPNLKIFRCTNVAVHTLPPLPVTLQELDCSGDSLSLLPPLPAGLVSLTCERNQLTELPSLPGSLAYLNCKNNNIHCFPAFPPLNNYLRVYLDTDKIKCFSNIRPQVLVFSINSSSPVTVPLCNPTNNVWQCNASPVMRGTVFYDYNSNGIQDTDEWPKKDVKISLSESNYTFSDNAGYYNVGTDGPGNFTINASEPPTYYDIFPNPATYTYNFTTNDTVVTGNFFLRPNALVDSLNFWAWQSYKARPGFSYPVEIVYENAGTTVLHPVITYHYDSSRMVYDSSTLTPSMNDGNTLRFDIGTLLQGRQNYILVFFRIKPTAIIGDTMTSSAAVTTGNISINRQLASLISGSFDPNDKQATPQLSPSQVANGEYIEYNIRFQNTGTDTAFNIVISDTLTSDLQAGSLQMIGSSHNCKTTVKNNVIYFEFLNILLPDSNVNELKSHGFVAFRIKPQPTVAVNSIITNKAAIYFDYNAPVITNIASTLIKEFIVVPLKLISFSALPQNDNTVSLYWNTANEINTKQFVMERSNDGLRFSSITTVFAKGKANNNYNISVADANTGITFYRLKIVDNDGSFAYSPIIKIDKRKNAAGFSVLSNPVKDFLIISTTDRTLNNTPASIINMQGAVVKTFIIKEGSQTIDINDLPKGVYYLRTLNGSSRIVIQ